MGDGLRRIEINDPEWGEVMLLFPLPKDGDSWGVLAPLRGTVWGEQIVVVAGEKLSHALHGWATPLMRVIGIKPQAHGKRISDVEGTCPQTDTCIMAGPNCRPGSETPDCYEPPFLESDAAFLATTVALAWAEGRFVIVVDGPEFSLS
ncbi:hypothetical protein N9917_01495 [Deltaproteobacteria bacterium]|nr:hypothetical protein [Deltaproteobacteria bacterium]